MNGPLDAPAPDENPLDVGTAVSLDASAQLLDARLLAGGVPWGLLRLSPEARRSVERWRDAGEVAPGEGRLARTLVQRGLLHPRRPLGDLDDVDVVIPVHEDVAGLSSLLSVLAPLHVTVVDDGSTRPVASVAQRAGAQVVRLEENRGPGTARNAGLAVTSRPLVWFLDADVTVEDPARLGAQLAGAFADPLVGAAAPRVRGNGPSVRQRFERSFGPLDMGARDALVSPNGPVRYLPSACLMVRRDAMGRGFDEGLRVGEDVDLIWRLHDHGWLVRYVADPVVVHRTRGSWRAWVAQRVGYGTSATPLAKRYDERLAPVRADRATWLTWAGVLAGVPVVSAHVTRSVRARLAQGLGDSADEPARVARRIVRHGVVGAGGPLARALVRSYGPWILLAALHPRLRRRALVLFAAGVAWRWRSTRLRCADVAPAVADDLSYAAGVALGAWRGRSLAALTPRIAPTSLTWRELFGVDQKRMTPRTFWPSARSS